MRVLILKNLSAGSTSSAIYDFERTLARDGDEIVMRTTDGTTALSALMPDIDLFDAIVADGGDGTVATVLYASRESGVPVLPFPGGTANLLVENLGLPVEPVALANLLYTGSTATYDMAEIDVTSTTSSAALFAATEAGPVDGSALSEQCDTIGFCMIAGAGFDATIMAQAVALKENLGAAAYFVAALANPMPTLSHFTLDLDGKTVESDGIAVLLVNFGKIQFDLSLTPGNDPRDGLLEVVVVKPQHTVMLLPAIIAAFLDRDGKNPTRTSALEIHMAREVHITADPPLPIQYDGEPTDYMTPFCARALHQVTRIVVPNGTPGARGPAALAHRIDTDGHRETAVPPTGTTYTV